MPTRESFPPVCHVGALRFFRQSSLSYAPAGSSFLPCPLHSLDTTTLCPQVHLIPHQFLCLPLLIIMDPWANWLCAYRYLHFQHVWFSDEIRKEQWKKEKIIWKKTEINFSAWIKPTSDPNAFLDISNFKGKLMEISIWGILSIDVYICAYLYIDIYY